LLEVEVQLETNVPPSIEEVDRPLVTVSFLEVMEPVHSIKLGPLLVTFVKKHILVVVGNDLGHTPAIAHNKRTMEIVNGVLLSAGGARVGIKNLLEVEVQLETNVPPSIEEVDRPLVTVSFLEEMEPVHSIKLDPLLVAFLEIDILVVVGIDLGHAPAIAHGRTRNFSSNALFLHKLDFISRNSKNSRRFLVKSRSGRGNSTSIVACIVIDDINCRAMPSSFVVPGRVGVLTIARDAMPIGSMVELKSKTRIAVAVAILKFGITKKCIDTKTFGLVGSSGTFQ